MTFQPTAAFARALVIGVGALVVGMLVRRIDLVVIAVPFLAHAVWMAASRPSSASAVLEPKESRIREGDALELTVTTPAGIVPTVWFDQVPSARFDPPYAAVVGDPTGRTTVLFEPRLWGRYGIGAARVVLGDPTGGWLCAVGTNSAHVRVRPQAATLVGGSGVARPIGIAGLHTSAQRGEGTQLTDIREFVPGDRLRRVNWRVTSRTGRLHVTQTLLERDTDVLIVADTLHDLVGAGTDARHDPAGAGTDAMSSLDATVRAIAAITHHYIGFGDRVGLHDLGRRIGPVSRGNGPRQARLVLDVLARAHRSVEPPPVLRRVPRLTSGTLVFVISPLLDDRVLDELVRLQHLGGEVIAVDTLPAALGSVDRLGKDRDWLSEGWAIRRLQRDATVARLEETGIPVVAWRGPASLASVLLAMEAARSAPRLRGGLGGSGSRAGR